jgi:hypothetical protein
MGTGTGSVLLRSLVIAVLALGAAGCSDDPEKPGTIPTPSPTESSTASTPTPTPVEAQVEAAVRTYYAELTRAAQTNDASRLKSMVMSSCPCYNAVKIIERNRREGETTPAARFTLRSAKVHDVNAKTAVAEVHYDVGAYDVLSRDGQVKTRIKAQSSHFDLSLLQVEGSWKVANVFDLEG